MIALENVNLRLNMKYLQPSCWLENYSSINFLSFFKHIWRPKLNSYRLQMIYVGLSWVFKIYFKIYTKSSLDFQVLSFYHLLMGTYMSIFIKPMVQISNNGCNNISFINSLLDKMWNANLFHMTIGEYRRERWFP